MSEHEPQGIVFWNTWYRAEPEAQLEHILLIEEELARQGVESVLLCLSEATHSASDGLVNRLGDEGFVTAYRATSNVRGIDEGLCIASREGLPGPDFTQLRKARAIANIKTRWLSTTKFNGIEVRSSHASYPRPPQEEVAGMTEALISSASEAQVLGGDFNTLIGKRSFIGQIEEAGMQKLSVTDGRTHTVPFRPFTSMGVELDHVFVSETLVGRASLEIYHHGPSNHNPLITRID